MTIRHSFFLIGAAAFSLFGIAAAKDYSPDLIELDGSNGLAFDASPQLVLADGGTVEFWIAPDWKESPDYDPAILSRAGPEGWSYLIAMLRDRSGLAIVAGSDEFVATFDFSDGSLHHVAVSQFDDGITVFVDGRPVGESETRFKDLPSAGVWVGTIDGDNNPFLGAIAGMRFWDVVLSPEDLVSFALKDVFDSDHPNIDALSAISNFTASEMMLVQTQSKE